MKEVKIYENAQFGQVRTAIGASGETLFCLTDVCNALGILARNIRMKLSEDVVVSLPRDSGRYKYMNYVTESGLYETILFGKTSKAKEFKRWLTSEVIPKTRKTGGYIPVKQGTTQEEFLADAMAVVKKSMAETEARMEKMQERIGKWEQLLLEQASKVKYYDKVLSSESTLTVNMIADCLGITAQKLNKLLCKWGIQYWQSGVYHLYAEYRDKDYACHKPSCHSEGGKVYTNQNMYWTERGKRFIIELFNKKTQTQQIWM